MQNFSKFGHIKNTEFSMVGHSCSQHWKAEKDCDFEASLGYVMDMEDLTFYFPFVFIYL